MQVCLRKVKEPTGRLGVGMQPETVRQRREVVAADSSGSAAMVRTA